MSNFNAYSKYYDLIYNNKNYSSEVDYVTSLFNKYGSKINNVLELGSGTGNHANYFTSKKYNITGIERSKEMVLLSNEKKINGFHAINGDISNTFLDIKFDAVISLFHVISYLTENDSILNCFKTTNKHLEVGGLFIFDVWFTPAVLTQQPSNKIKKLEDENIKVVRIAEPLSDHTKNTIDVNFSIFITNKRNSSTELIEESHKMRHFSISEIDLLCKLSGFEILHTEEFLTTNNPDTNTWGVCFVLRKIKDNE
jgi:SAM-dependent methyltransferase